MRAILERAEDRGHAQHGWLESYFSFSFADYHNPNRMGFGALRVLNDDTVAPGKGFDMHPHKNMEVISIPLKGSLHHRDSEGHQDMIRWGQIQVMSTGTGLLHSEYNDDSLHEPLKFLQIWVIPNVLNTPPKYKVFDYLPFLKQNQFSLIISPDGDAPGSIRQDAWFSIGELHHGVSTVYKLHRKDAGVYVFVLGGEVKVADFELHARDGLGLSDVDTIDFTAEKNSTVLLIEVPMK
ncbi:MAG: pirin family protein [Bacteroidales bacterium]